MGAIRVEELREVGALEAVAGAWSALAEGTAELPYVTPEFMLAWVRSLGSGARARVLAAWDGDELVGVAPMFDRRVGRFGVGFVARGFPIRGSSPPFDLVVPRVERGAEVVDAVIGHWAQDRSWDLIELRHVPRASAALALLRAGAARAGLVVENGEGGETVSVPVTGTWEEYFESRPKMLRQNHRRALRRCEAIGATKVVRFPAPGMSLEDGLGLAFGVIEHSWKDPGEDRAASERFFRDLAACLHRAGKLSMRFVLVGDVPVAYLFEIEHRGSVHAFHIAYHLEFQREGPGVIVLADAIREAHERGLKAYELGSSAEYLRRWGEARDSLVTVRLRRDSRASAAKARLFLWMRDRRTAEAKRRTESVKQERKHGAAEGDGGGEGDEAP